jgi:phage terminase small subunit
MPILTDKQKIFIESYVSSRNATQAALDAGYSAKTARAMGSENLTKPYIKDVIDARLAELTRKFSIETEDILKRLEHEAKTAKNASDRLRANELLGKYKGIFKENQSSNVTIVGNVLDKALDKASRLANIDENSTKLTHISAKNDTKVE